VIFEIVMTEFVELIPSADVVTVPLAVPVLIRVTSVGARVICVVKTV